VKCPKWHSLGCLHSEASVLEAENLGRLIHCRVNRDYSGFGGLEDAYWPLVPKFAASNPAEAVGFFRVKNIVSTPSFGGEVKPAVTCRRFAACKRFLNVTWKSAFWQNYRLLFLAHWSSTYRSRRIGRADIWRRQWEFLENRVYNKPNDCSATGALAPGPDHHQQQTGVLHHWKVKYYKFTVWMIPCSRIMALGWTQDLREMSTRNISCGGGGGEGGQWVGLTILPSSRDGSLEIWKPQPPGSFWACPGLYRDFVHLPFTVGMIRLFKMTRKFEF
jgi:hypothetical protein